MAEQEPTVSAGEPGAAAAAPRLPAAVPREKRAPGSPASRSRRRRPDAGGEIDLPADIAASERALGNLLTVIKAEAQLLERSVLPAGRHQPERTGVRLAAIVRMVDEATVELHRLSHLRAHSPRLRHE